MFNLNEFRSVALAPESEDQEWLEGAESAVKFVESNSQSDEIILHASLGQALITSALAPLSQLEDCDSHELQSEIVDVYSTFGIQPGYNETDETYIASPLDGSPIFDGGEQLVFLRKFDGVEQRMQPEISQRLIHTLGLYWRKDQSAFCKLDDRGDVQPILRIFEINRAIGDYADIVVTIKRDELDLYMAASSTALVMRFDFTRFKLGDSFGGWVGSGEMKHPNTDLVYHSKVQSRCSFVNGALIVRSLITNEEAGQQKNGLTKKKNT